MKIDFYVPPLSKQTGGLERAIRGLIDALNDCGTDVAINPDRAKGSCAHFHGLWDPKMLSIYKRYRKERSPYIVSPHGMLEPWAWEHRGWKKRPYFRFFEEANLLSASAILATSPLEARNISHRVPQAKRVVDIPLGIDPPPEADQLSPVDSEAFRILFLSRIDVKKGIDMLLTALRGKHRQGNGQPIELHIVGDGDHSYEATLRDYAKSHAEDLPEIIWHGGVWGDAKWDHLRNADLFCLPTHSENFGIAVLEAMAVGTQVLTTDQTPWGELAPVDGVKICRAEMDSLRSALEQIFANEEWNEAQRADLLAWTKRNFSWDKLAPRYRELYEEVTTK